MAKFRINLKLQGLELEIEGSREDAPMIASNLGRQFTNLLGPAASIVEGEAVVVNEKVVPVQAQPAADGASPKRRRARRRSTTSNGTDAADKSAVAIDWTHDVEKFGLPQQSWSAPKKGMWLLWIVSQQTTPAQVELTRFQITETFNKHFKSAGPIRQDNLARDFGKEKTRRPPRVSEDASQEPSLWFLTDAGKKYAQALVTEALGGNTAPDEAETSE
ncbi:MAG: hypothetical protein ACJ796_08880 [Gemmatimonadaceae bacterium]